MQHYEILRGKKKKRKKKKNTFYMQLYLNLIQLKCVSSA